MLHAHHHIVGAGICMAAVALPGFSREKTDAGFAQTNFRSKGPWRNGLLAWQRWQGRSVDANPPPAARGTRGRSFLILVRVPRTRCAFGPGRLPLGTDKIFEELDSVALRGQDSSDVGQRISRDQACVDQCSFLDTAGDRLCRWRPPRSRCGRRHGFSKGLGDNVICTLPVDGAFRRDNVILEKTGFGGVVRGGSAHWFAVGPALNFLEFPRRRVQSARPLGGAKDRRRGTGGPAALQSALSSLLARVG